MLNTKKSQAWGMDVLIAITIFSAIIFVFFIYATNQSGEGKQILESLQSQGKTITNIILSEGYPQDWTEDNVIKIGILSDNIINTTKLEKFYNLTLTEYNKTKILFNTHYDYFLFFNENITINSIEIEGIGKPETTKTNINAKNIIKTTRYVIYKDKPVTIYIYIWEK